MAKARKVAKLPDECVPICLRKIAAARLGEPDVSELMLVSVIGWITSSQAEVYTKKAKRKMIAKKAMDMPEDRKQN